MPPKNLTLDILNDEIPTSNKSTIAKNPHSKVQSSEEIKPSQSIYDFIKKEEKKSKEQVGVTLDKNIVDKLKTVAIDSNITMSKLFETLLTPLVESVEVKPANVKKYNEKNKGKGRRTNK